MNSIKSERSGTAVFSRVSEGSDRHEGLDCCLRGRDRPW